MTDDGPFDELRAGWMTDGDKKMVDGHRKQSFVVKFLRGCTIFFMMDSGCVYAMGIVIIVEKPVGFITDNVFAEFGV
ncbi:MAG: hypothetical protein HY958_12585, partial [Bacteroidia bacterium]|nr:hypothetical protein [Bacteroidia bacterium]